MKTKNIILLGGIGFAIYYLTKKKTKPTIKPVKKDLTDVSNGDEPTTLGGVKPPKPTKLSQEELKAIFNKANKYYKGGARPTESLIQKFKLDRERALAEIKARGLESKFLAWKKSQRKNLGDIRMAKPIFGKPRIARNRLGLTNVPPMAV